MEVALAASAELFVIEPEMWRDTSLKFTNSEKKYILWHLFKQLASWFFCPSIAVFFVGRNFGSRLISETRISGAQSCLKDPFYSIKPEFNVSLIRQARTLTYLWKNFPTCFEVPRGPQAQQLFCNWKQFPAIARNFKVLVLSLQDTRPWLFVCQTEEAVADFAELFYSEPKMWRGTSLKFIKLCICDIFNNWTKKLSFIARLSFLTFR
jgi:hypothetical protein